MITLPYLLIAEDFMTYELQRKKKNIFLYPALVAFAIIIGVMLSVYYDNRSLSEVLHFIFSPAFAIALCGIYFSLALHTYREITRK